MTNAVVTNACHNNISNLQLPQQLRLNGKTRIYIVVQQAVLGDTSVTNREGGLEMNWESQADARAKSDDQDMIGRDKYKKAAGI